MEVGAYGYAGNPSDFERSLITSIVSHRAVYYCWGGVVAAAAAAASHDSVLS